jgi:hypothetical protein
MSIKRYKVSYDWSFDMVVDIDHGVCKDDLLHEINNFWSEADYRLSQADGDIAQAVLKLLAQAAFRSTIADWNALDEFKVKGVEGWPLLNGSAGITLVSIDDFEFEADEFTIRAEGVGKSDQASTTAGAA